MGCFVWIHRIQENKNLCNLLERIQKLATLHITGGLQKSPNITLDIIAGLMPINVTLNFKAVTTSLRLKVDNNWVGQYSLSSKTVSHAKFLDQEISKLDIAKNINLLELGADVEENATDCTSLRPHGEYIDETDIDEITSRTLVFARAKPEDKIEIVKSLQRQGLVASMTGDGVNDAPALKEADIGVAMGISGTEVAKGASDMILTDDNFCSIVSAVEKGRVIYANIQKFVCFLLSTNIGEILLIFTTMAIGLPIPLEPLQILVLNLFSDGMPAVALSLEKGDPNIMDDRPRPKSQHIIHGRLWLFVICNAFFIFGSALCVFLVGCHLNFKEFLLDDILGPLGPQYQYTQTPCDHYDGGFVTIGNCRRSLNFDFPIYIKTEDQLTSWDKDDKKDDGDQDFYGGVTYFESYQNETGVVLKVGEKYPDDYPLKNCRGETIKTEEDDDEYACIPEGLGKIQAMTFISITTTEVLRAYTVRSFTSGVWVGMFSNKYMQYAAGASILLTIFVTNTPWIMDVLFGFEYIPWYCWIIAYLGAFNSVFWGEVLKAFCRRSDKKNKRWAHVEDNFEHLLLEIRTLRHHVEKLESKQ